MSESDETVTGVSLTVTSVTCRVSAVTGTCTASRSVYVAGCGTWWVYLGGVYRVHTRVGIPGTYQGGYTSLLPWVGTSLLPWVGTSLHHWVGTSLHHWVGDPLPITGWVTFFPSLGVVLTLLVRHWVWY